MNANVGALDRVLRAVIGALILVLGWVYGTPWGLLGLLPLATGLFGRCPLYSAIGISTKRR